MPIACAKNSGSGHLPGHLRVRNDVGAAGSTMHATARESLVSAECDGGDAIELSVVIPCLNEIRTVGRCVSKALQALQRLGVPGEVIVADNGSLDGSPQEAACHGAHVVC